MIQVVVYEPGRYAPLIHCDACGERIDDPTKAGVWWDLDVDEPQHPRIACKNIRCANTVEALYSLPGDQSLDIYLGDLLWNTGIKTADQAEALLSKSERWASYGL